MKKTILSLALLAASVSAFAAPGYLSTNADEHVKSGTGLCWRTSSWTPAQATKECDADLVKKEVVEAPMVTPAVMPEVKMAPLVTGMKPTATKLSVSFAFDKTVLSAEAKQTIDKVFGGWMDASTTMLKISVVGHADKIGSDGYNQKLSEKRANAVKAYLISKGAPADLIAVSGKGEKEPLVTCQKPKGVVDCLKTNRRVEIEAHGEVNFVINN